MKWISDTTGRFPKRPFYDEDDIEHECELVLSKFYAAKNGAITYPISTNDLTILLEQKAGSLDLYADLSKYGEDVEGVTEFFPNKNPAVFILRNLSEDPRRENRYRTTLTHELGHVHLHSFLLSGGQKRLFGADAKERNHCKRESILGASKSDWMEWQAGFASGAFLMPLTPLKELVRMYYQTANALAVGGVNSPEGIELVRKVAAAFQVSEDAARVRLLKRKFLSEQPISPHF